MPIIRWTPDGLLPPVDPHQSLTAEQSPYRVNAVELDARFASNPKRILLLEGLLAFREKFQQIGVTSGFQWLDGSFVEDIERLEHRSPNDLDIVTFLRIDRSIQRDVVNRSPDLFDRALVRRQFGVDNCYRDLTLDVEAVIRDARGEYALFSHRRNRSWKGFLQMSLTPAEVDQSAAQLLATMNSQSGVST